MMTALMMTAAGASEVAAPGDPPETSGGRTFVGLTVPLSTGGFAVEAERELDERFSVGLALRAAFNLGRWSGVMGDSGTEYLLLGLEPGARFYLTGSALDGMWLGPRLELAHAWQESLNQTPQGNVVSAQREWNLGGALLAGYSIRLGEGFSVQAALGAGVTYRRGTVTGIEPAPQTGKPQRETHPFHSWNVGHRAQLSVGWAF